MGQTYRHFEGKRMMMSHNDQVPAIPEPAPSKASDGHDRPQKNLSLSGIDEGLYHRLVELSPDGILMHCNELIEYINPSGLEILGAQSIDQILGHSILEFVHPDFQHQVSRRIEQVRDGSPVGVIEEKHIRLDKKIVDLEVMALPFSYRSKAACLVVMRDVTERKSLEAQLFQAQKMEAIGRLAGGIAHDFNNLLTAISGYTELSIRKGHSDCPAFGYILEIQSVAVRAADLTRQLLTFSRQQIIKPQIVDMNQVILNLRKMIGRLIGENIELFVQTAEDLGNVLVDPGQLEQVVLNLVINARDAMPQGGKISIQTSQTIMDESIKQHHPEMAASQYAVLSISDTGCGMSDEVRSHIFEPFFTTKDKGKGTGLGLATVYGIVKQSSGFIDIYSEPGLGSSFKVYLPILRGNLCVKETETAPEILQIGGGETILLVEDEILIREMALKFLTDQGYMVHCAATGRQALEIVVRNGSPVDLLLSDIVLPDMNGLDLAAQITQACPSIRILFTSGYADASIAKDHILGNSDNFMPKPYSPSMLTQKIREILNN